MTILTDRNTQRSEALIARIAELAERHGQSEIARKTEFSNNNVSRYVKGTRVPLDFGTALVEDLGVNPAWLLTGQGTPYLSDVSAGTAEMAGDLLALVNAMAAVSHMRLGSLVGKHHLTVLRELNQALERYEELRGKLNRHSEGIFRELLTDAQAAFDRRDFDKGEELAKAAAQVGRMCENEDLQAWLHAQLATVDYTAGRQRSGLQHQRAAFLNAMLKNSGRDESVQKAAHNYAKMLIRDHRLQEARRIAEAATALAGGHSTHVESVTANMDLEFGEINRAIGATARLLPQLEQPYIDNSIGPNYLRAQLLAGALPMAEAIGLGASTPAKWMRLLEAALLFEDVLSLERCLALGIDGKNAPGLDHPCVGRARAVVRALRGKPGASPLKDVEAPAKGAGEVDRFTHAVFSAQVLRLAGKVAQARKHAREAADILDALDPELSPRIEARLIHARNVQLLSKPGDAAHTSATELLRDYLARGYRCLQQFSV